MSVKNMTKWITVPAVGVVSAAAGITAAFGWSRLTGLDAAQAQLRGLGYEADDVERISANLVEALDGGMMTMAEATSAAATAMAAGVEEGDELARYIQILDSAVVGGTGSFQEMEQIFGRIVDQGKMTRTEFDMIAQRMPGFSSAVQEAMGVSSEEMYEMLRTGEITTDQFLDVMEGFSGDMAAEYAKSWDGMVQNTKAYIGIIGEQLLGGVFEQSKESIAEFIEFLKSDEVMEWAQITGEAIGEAFTNIVERIQAAIEWYKQLDEWQQKLILGFGAFLIAMGPFLSIFGQLLQWLPVIVNGFKLLGAAIGLLFSPMGLVVLLIGALIAAGMLLWQNWEEIWAKAVEIWNNIAEFLGINTEGIKEKILSIWGSIKEFFAETWEWLKGVTTEAWESISDSISHVMEHISRLISEILSFISDFWAEHGEAIKRITKDTFEMIKNDIQTAMKIAQAIISTAWDIIKTIFETAIGVITGLVQFFAGLITGDFEMMKEGLIQIWEALWEGIKGIVESGWDLLSSAFSSLWDSISDWFTDLKDSAVDWGKNMIDGFIDGIVSMGKDVADAAKGVVDSAADFLKFWSPAKKGEGRYIVHWGANMIDGFLDGVRSQEDLTGTVMNEVVGTMSPNQSNQSVKNIPVDRNNNRSLNEISSLLLELIKAVKQNRDVYLDGDKVTGIVNRTNAINDTTSYFMY